MTTLYKYGSLMPCQSRGRSTCNVSLTITGCPGDADNRCDAEATMTSSLLSIRDSTMTVRGFDPSFTSVADARTAAEFESMVRALAYNPGPPTSHISTCTRSVVMMATPR